MNQEIIDVIFKRVGGKLMNEMRGTCDKSLIHV